MSNVQFKVLALSLRLMRLKEFSRKHWPYMGSSAVHTLEDIEFFFDSVSELASLYEAARLSLVHAGHVQALLKEVLRQNLSMELRNAVLAAKSDADAVYSICDQCVDFLFDMLSGEVTEGLYLASDLVELTSDNH